MSATIPETMLISDLLKATGYNCPEELKESTFDAATSGGGSGVVLEDNKTVSITENGTIEITPTAGKDAMKKVTATVNVSGGGSSSASAYYWKALNHDENSHFSNLDKAPTDTVSFQTSWHMSVYSADSVDIKHQGDYSIEVFGERISDTKFTTIVRGSTYETYERVSSKDFTLWQD